MPKFLAPLVAQRPFPEFSQWWPMGRHFPVFMSAAILAHWVPLDAARRNMGRVEAYLAEYLRLVYRQGAHPNLLTGFVEADPARTFFSGEFDGLSYAFYRSAFEMLAKQYDGQPQAYLQSRRDFTIQVGRTFFGLLREHLQLDLPPALESVPQFDHLVSSLERVSAFLLGEGYLRDTCRFSFEVDCLQGGERLRQPAGDFLTNLQRQGFGYALYRMGYPAILPSAVYLYQLYGEAQHHSSRLIEELFKQVGYAASENRDFDPSQFPSDQVVELWRIEKLGMGD